MLKNIFLGKEIGQLLTKVREKSGLSQIEVAKRIGLSTKSGQGYISRLEKGKTKNPLSKQSFFISEPAVLRGPPSTYFQRGFPFESPLKILKDGENEGLPLIFMR